MKKYLEEKSIYVKNEDKMIYKIVSFEAYDGYTTLTYDLELVAGYDYIDPDNNDIQGYVSAEKFIEEVRTETVVQYFFEEGLKDCLEENGYEILDKLPTIH